MAVLIADNRVVCAMCCILSYVNDMFFIFSYFVCLCVRFKHLCEQFLQVKSCAPLKLMISRPLLFTSPIWHTARLRMTAAVAAHRLLGFKIFTRGHCVIKKTYVSYCCGLPSHTVCLQLYNIWVRI